MVEKKTKEKTERAKQKEKEKAEVAKQATHETKHDVKCTDKKCPFHSSLSLRGRSFEGEITRKRDKTVRVEWLRFKYFPKYERYAKVKSALFAHLPECLAPSVHTGDKVKITECRPLSKTKHFVVVGRV